MSRDYGFGWRPYVPVAERRAKAARELAKLTKKSGQKTDPVVLEGKRIATSFWGKAWCDNLESYSDFENRLPRGRTYVRNGSVVDLQIAKGTVTARVSGSSLYRVEITIRPLADKIWAGFRKECAGQIDSLLALLQGRISPAVMQLATRHDRGLFPAPTEIRMKCSCPDWAEMCKHVAATLYGVGARLDHRPELLFSLRGVDPEELIAGVTSADAVGTATPSAATPGLAAEDLAGVFGIELEEAAAPTAIANPARGTSRTKKVAVEARVGVKPARRARSLAKPKKRARPARSTKG